MNEEDGKANEVFDQMKHFQEEGTGKGKEAKEVSQEGCDGQDQDGKGLLE